jgi:hypothetical protein
VVGRLPQLRPGTRHRALRAQSGRRPRPPGIFTLADDQTHLGIGARIVADSDPRQEWAETELKVSRLTSIMPGLEPSALLNPSGR